MSLLKTFAQDAIAVSKEPLHKTVLENQFVRVLELHIAPGDTTMFHKHETPCVSISLRPGRTGAETILDDKSPKVASLDRRISFDAFYNSPRIHRVWNRDTATFHWMDVEVLTKGDGSLQPAMTTQGFTMVFDAPPVRAYRLTLTGKQPIEFKRTAPILIVALNAGSMAVANKHAFTKQGDFLFVNASTEVQIINNNNVDCSFAVLELK